VCVSAPARFSLSSDRDASRNFCAHVRSLRSRRFPPLSPPHPLPPPQDSQDKREINWTFLWPPPPGLCRAGEGGGGGIGGEGLPACSRASLIGCRNSFRLVFNRRGDTFHFTPWTLPRQVRQRPPPHSLSLFFLLSALGSGYRVLRSTRCGRRKFLAHEIKPIIRR